MGVSVHARAGYHGSRAALAKGSQGCAALLGLALRHRHGHRLAGVTPFFPCVLALRGHAVGERGERAEAHLKTQTCKNF